MKTEKLPKLRFPDFKGSWEKFQLHDVAIFLDGRRKPIKSSDRLKIQGEIPYYGASGIIDYVNDFIFDEEIILLGEDGENILSRNQPLAFKVTGKSWVNNHAHVIKPKEGTNIDFLTQTLERINYTPYNTGTAQPKLNKEVCKGISFNLPTLPEQTKIANFLTAVDAKIANLSEEKSHLENYKKGVMQKIFSQELRFKQEDGSDFPEWETKRLGKIGKTINGLTGKTKENFGEGFPYIQYKQIFDSSRIDIKKCGLVEIEEGESQSLMEYGDVLFTTSSETPNEIGTASVLLDEVDRMYLNSFCFCFRIDQNVLNPEFSQFLFRSANFRRKMIPLAQGSTRYNISKSSFVNLKITIPNISEQAKIANFLTSIDEKINTAIESIEKAQEWKKGLLQQLFV